MTTEELGGALLRRAGEHAGEPPRAGFVQDPSEKLGAYALALETAQRIERDDLRRVIALVAIAEQRPDGC